MSIWIIFDPSVQWISSKWLSVIKVVASFCNSTISHKSLIKWAFTFHICLSMIERRHACHGSILDVSHALSAIFLRNLRFYCRQWIDIVQASYWISMNHRQKNTGAPWVLGVAKNFRFRWMNVLTFHGRTVIRRRNWNILSSTLLILIEVRRLYSKSKVIIWWIWNLSPMISIYSNV